MPRLLLIKLVPFSGSLLCHFAFLSYCNADTNHAPCMHMRSEDMNKAAAGFASPYCQAQLKDIALSQAFAHAYVGNR